MVAISCSAGPISTMPSTHGEPVWNFVKETDIKISLTKLQHRPRELIYFFFFRERVYLCSPGCPGTHFVDQAGLEIRNLPASASQVLGLKACTTTPGQNYHFKRVFIIFSYALLKPPCKISKWLYLLFENQPSYFWYCLVILDFNPALPGWAVMHRETQ